MSFAFSVHTAELSDSSVVERFGRLTTKARLHGWSASNYPASVIFRGVIFEFFSEEGDDETDRLIRLIYRSPHREMWLDLDDEVI